MPSPRLPANKRGTTGVRHQAEHQKNRRIVKLLDFSRNIGPAHPPLIATLGFFDGVHVGHRFLIGQVKEVAREERLPSAVVTFPIHPRKVLQQDYQPKLLCGYDEKLLHLATTGIDYCVSLPFTAGLSQLSARDFMERVLKEKIGVKKLLIGYDHRFGRDREEGFAQYKRYGEELNMEVLQAEEFRFGGCDVSSSQIRRLLAEGDIVKANELLSYSYTLSGKIVEGYQVGRTIGFPTANIEAWERYKVIPRLGVYAVRVIFGGICRKGMLYIGTRPTLHSDNKISVEVNIFDFSGDLYNQSLTVEFVDFIRADRKFDNMDALVSQIHRDKESVARRLENVETGYRH